jgi:hypothetical protein
MADCALDGQEGIRRANPRPTARPRSAARPAQARPPGPGAGIAWPERLEPSRRRTTAPRSQRDRCLSRRCPASSNTAQTPPMARPACPLPGGIPGDLGAAFSGNAAAHVAPASPSRPPLPPCMAMSADRTPAGRADSQIPGRESSIFWRPLAGKISRAFRAQQRPFTACLVPGVYLRYRAPRGAVSSSGGGRPSPPRCRSSVVKLGAA